MRTSAFQSVLTAIFAAALIAIAPLALAQAPVANAQSEKVKAPAPRKARRLQTENTPRSGDFDKMLERRLIRVYAPYSRSLYFVDKGRERGLAAELVRDFDHWINKKYAKQLGKRPISVHIVAATRDKLFSGLREGLADISVGNLTITEQRETLVDFVGSDHLRAVNEILVTGPASPAIDDVDDLSGKWVHVREASSYYHSLLALNERFRQAGKPEVTLIIVPDALEDEDLMEMMNAGLLQAVVVDDWKATMWAQVLPKLKVRDDIVLREGGKTGWAIREDSPKLAAEINEFFVSWAKKAGVIAHRQRQYMRRIKELHDPTRSADYKRFQQTVALFEKYGSRYHFDPLMLAAQGYQESTLDQSKRSPVGAIGVMQIMPATGAELRVGDITITEPNIHAGTKYMDHLMTSFFPDAKFSDQNRTLFAFASYNAGPGNISRMRREAKKRGLDPDEWFNNVEVVTAEKIGIETTTYVRNIEKYYVSYRLTLDARLQMEKARQQVTPAKN
jgi:membrane-bound lytic murein transglycosylase MltF